MPNYSGLFKDPVIHSTHPRSDSRRRQLLGGIARQFRRLPERENDPQKRGW